MAERAPETARPVTGGDNDRRSLKFDVDLIARMKGHAITNLLRNHDLSF